MACLRPVSTVAHTLLQAAIKLALPQRTWDPSSLGTLAAPAPPPPPHSAPLGACRLSSSGPLAPSLLLSALGPARPSGPALPGGGGVRGSQTPGKEVAR